MVRLFFVLVVLFELTCLMHFAGWQEVRSDIAKQIRLAQIERLAEGGGAMRRILFVLLVAVVLSGMLSLFMPVMASAQTTVAATVFEFDFPWKHSTLDVAGLQWAFYSDGANEYYKTSADLGNTWSSPVLVRASSTVSHNFDWATDGTYIYYLYLNTAFRRGLALGNGTITWSAGEQATGLTSTQYSYLVVDSAGYPVSTYYHSLDQHVAICGQNDGTWSSTASNTVVDAEAGYAVYPALVAFDSRQLLYIGCANNNTRLRAKFYDGADWSSLVYTVASCLADSTIFASDSVVRDGDYADVVFLDTSHNVVYVQYDTLTNTFGAEHTIAAAGAYSQPEITHTTLGKYYCFWEHYPATNDIRYSVRNSYGVWSAPALLIGNDTLYTGVHEYCNYHITQESDEDTVGAYYQTNTNELHFAGIYATGTDSPVGIALDATDVGAKSATLNGHVVWDGGSFVTALFEYSGGGSGGNETVSGLVTDDDFSVEVTGLIPSNWYVYWIVFTNDTGEYYSNLIHFETASTTETDVPIAETNDVSNLGETSVRLNGRVRYDGGLDCVVGFEWRVSGAGSWLDGWNPVHGGYLRTDESFSGDLADLQRNTTYEYRAQVKNSLGTGYGDIKTFKTPYATAPTPTPGTGIVPGSWGIWLSGTSSNVKLLIAIVVTIGLMVIVATKLKQATSSGIVVVGTGLACVIAFTIFGWYPGWVIVLVAVAMGLGLLFLITRGGH